MQIIILILIKMIIKGKKWKINNNGDILVYYDDTTIEVFLMYD